MRRSSLAVLLLALAPGSLFAGNVHQVRIRNMVFDPPTIEVKAGDTIKWTNEDIVPHTATGTSFDSGLIAPGGSWSLTLKDAGETSYKCSYHPTMVARIKVSKRP